MSLLTIISMLGGTIGGGGSSSLLPAARTGSTAYVAGEGDSIAQPTPAYGNSFSYQGRAASKLGVSYWNSGVGGSQTSTIKTRVNSIILPKKPNIVIVEGGINDVYYRGTGSSTVADDAATIQNLKDIITACINNGVLLVVRLNIGPWTNGTNDQMTSVHAINSAINSWALATYPDKFIVIDTAALIGEFRPGGSVGNLDNIQTKYDSDGTHYNQWGYLVLGEKIADSIFDFYSVTKPTAPSGMSVDDSGNLIDWTHASGHSSAGDYEYSEDGGFSWADCTAKPQSIGNLARYTEMVRLRTKGTYRPSDEIYNASPFTETASSNDVTFPTATNLTQTNRVLIPSASGWGNTGLSGKKLASGTAGRIMCQYAFPTNANFVLGFKTSNAEGGYSTINAGFRTYEDGKIERFESGTGTVVTDEWLKINDWVCIYRNGSTLKLQKSSNDGSSWTDLVTYTFSSSADLFVDVDVYGTFGRLFYVKGENLI